MLNVMTHLQCAQVIFTHQPAARSCTSAQANQADMTHDLIIHDSRELLHEMGDAMCCYEPRYAHKTKR